MKGARVLTSEEIRLLLKAESPRDRMLVLVGLYFGTRISETIALTFEKFKGSYLHIRSLKGSNHRYLLIPDEFRHELENLKQYYLSLAKPVTEDTPVPFPKANSQERMQANLT